MDKFLSLDIQGYKTELPILPLPSGINIAFFNLHGDVPKTEHCGKKLAEHLRDCEVLITADPRVCSSATFARENSGIIIMRLRENRKSFICRTESKSITARR